MSGFEDRTAIVTGAASGLGREVALLLGVRGARVACLDLAEEGAESTVAAIRQRHGTAGAWRVDVADPVAVRRSVANVASELGPPAFVANAAGTTRFGHAHEYTFEEWSRIVAVNLTGTFLVAQAAVVHMLDQGFGSIVNVASHVGLVGMAYNAAYCAAKGGVVNLTRALAVEYQARGIRVNCVAPGGMATPLAESAAKSAPADADPSFLAGMATPFGVADPLQVARVVVFILSEDADYMTGAVIPVDAGLTAS